MSTITSSAVLSALSTVIDPDFRKDLVSLGMIKDLSIDGNKISFIIELTTHACPLKEQLEADSRAAIAKGVSETAEVNIVFTSKVTSLRDIRSEVLPGVKNIIVVASGKGGVGKSTVSVNLALGLAKSGAKVGLIDADIHGPSIPMMLGLKNEKPGLVEVDGKHKILPVDSYGIKVLSIGFLVDDKQAVVWRGPMVTSALRQFVTDVVWGDLDYMIIDLPPGTGDVHLTMAQILPVTGAVIVTTPQDVALADAKKAVAMFLMDSINIPVLGVVENMAYFIPEDMPGQKYYIFGKNGGRVLADMYGFEFLGELPLEESIREGGDRGAPAILQSSPGSAAFETLVANIARRIAVVNAEKLETADSV
jgi:ATP-binding protein involved in chromosome partitioning